MKIQGGFSFRHNFRKPLILENLLQLEKKGINPP